jgi:uracil-DNA glycosylase
MTEALDRLAGEIRACRICRDAPWTTPLPHEPRPILVESDKARIVIASQAPGTKAHRSGVPFEDASGGRLRDWLGVSHGDFYRPGNFIIAPMGFCFPGQDSAGGDLPPRRECAPTWRERLLALMPQVDLVLTIGLYSQVWHLGGSRSGTLTDTVANWRAILGMSGAPLILPLPHPSWRNTSWIKRNPWFERELLPMLRDLVDRRITRAEA